jgi:hypothetical protein
MTNSLTATYSFLCLYELLFVTLYSYLTGAYINWSVIFFVLDMLADYYIEKATKWVVRDRSIYSVPIERIKKHIY